MERSSPEVSQSLGLGPWTRCGSISTETERSIELNGVAAGAVFSGAGKRREYVAIMIDVSKIGFSLWTNRLWKIYYHRIQVQSQPLYTGG